MNKAEGRRQDRPCARASTTRRSRSAVARSATCGSSATARNPRRVVLDGGQQAERLLRQRAPTRSRSTASWPATTRPTASSSSTPSATRSRTSSPRSAASTASTPSTPRAARCRTRRPTTTPTRASTSARRRSRPSRSARSCATSTAGATRSASRPRNMRYVTITAQPLLQQRRSGSSRTRSSRRSSRPPRTNVITDNDVFWNNFNVHAGAPFKPKTTGVVPLVPVGTGILLLGGRDQPRRGQPRLRQLPGRRRRGRGHPARQDHRRRARCSATGHRQRVRARRRGPQRPRPRLRRQRQRQLLGPEHRRAGHAAGRPGDVPGLPVRRRERVQPGRAERAARLHGRERAQGLDQAPAQGQAGRTRRSRSTRSEARARASPSPAPRSSRRRRRPPRPSRRRSRSPTTTTCRRS